MAKRDLVKLLVGLYGDPKLKARLEKNASRTMKAARLSAREQELLASGDAAKLREYLGKDTLRAQIIQLPAMIIQSTKKK